MRLKFTLHITDQALVDALRDYVHGLSTGTVVAPPARMYITDHPEHLTDKELVSTVYPYIKALQDEPREQVDMWLHVFDAAVKTVSLGRIRLFPHGRRCADGQSCADTRGGTMDPCVADVCSDVAITAAPPPPLWCRYFT